MAKLNKNIISPVLEHGNGYVFNVAGQNFKIVGSHIDTFNEANADFNSLIAGQRTFNINENSVDFIYDYNNKSIVSSIDESAFDNFNKTIEAQEKLDFIKESTKTVKLGKSTEALNEAKNEIALLEAFLSTMNRSPRAIRFTYNVSENTVFANNIEILNHSDSVVESIFASGYIKYEDKSLFRLFEFTGKNHSAYKRLDFIVESRSNNIAIATMKAGHNVYVWRLNEETTIGKFSKLLPDAAIDYVAEHTGADVTFLVEDILESFSERREAKRTKIAQLHEMIAFLKDQKGRIAEADRNLPDIKAADNLINTEITRLSEELTDAQNEELLGLSDGYLDATVSREAEGLKEGDPIKVDAVEYAAAGKDDTLTVFANDEPLRIEKFRVELEAGAGI